MKEEIEWFRPNEKLPGLGSYCLIQVAVDWAFGEHMIYRGYFSDNNSWSIPPSLVTERANDVIAWAKLPKGI